MKHIVIDARESGTSTGRYIDKLIEYLHKIKPGHKVTIITTRKRVEFMEKIAPKFKVQSTRVKEFTFAEQLTLLKQIKKLQPDLVFFPASQQPLLYRGKVVTTIQDLTTVRFRNPAKNRVVYAVKRRVYVMLNKIVGRKSRLLITPSEFVKDDYAKFAHVNSRKITVTHESADKITNKSEPIDELVGKQYIMYVGRPTPHKNLGRLIDAFEILRQQHPHLRLVLAGKKDASYYQHEKSVKARGIKNVLFTDFVSEGQLRWLYENTAAYVFPSLSEGFGLPPLEAMQHGAPIVSSDATCLPEIYQDAALYFDPLDVKDMAKKIERMITDTTLRQKHITKGYAVVKQYSWERMARQTLEVFNEALDN
jgi:glycosyltransferase involved in cell wall biosynthesis